ncbi:MAG: arylsulfotransferase family protein [Bradymonadaceae bacterium]
MVRYAPVTNGLKWSYSGSSDDPFDSMSWGSQQMLPNGNVLVTESMAGRIFEVTPSGEIV